MTPEQFTEAKSKLAKLSMACEDRERFMRDAIRHYYTGDYVWAMTYQFHFLAWQDEVARLSDESVGTPSHRLWFILGGRP